MLPIRLAQACFRFGWDEGVRQDFILVREELVAFYIRLGYVVAGAEVMYPGVGLWTPLRLDLDAVDRGAVRSVLRIRQMGRRVESPGW